MTNSVNMRALSLDILIEVLEHDKYSHLVLRDVLDKYAYLEKQERAFLTRLTEGTIERKLELDYIINQFSKTKVNKMKPVIRNILRMGVYQLRYMDAVPDSAVCNEAVKLAKKRGFSQLSGFVNGVLRAVARGLDSIQWPSEETDLASYLEVKYSMPKWIVQQWIASYGTEKTQSILKKMGEDKGLTVRTNLDRITPDELVKRLQEEGAKAYVSQRLPYALHITDMDKLADLPSFQEGLFYVQDISSMCVAEAAGVKAGNYVIDVCAAPGGKSTHLAELLKGTGQVEARDLTEYKVGLIEDNIALHQLLNMCAVMWDATQKDAESIGKADVLICDLPCSGLGVMGKKTDIRYKMTEEKEESLVSLQREILDTVWEYLKPGGTMVYSTCTIHTKENEGNVEWFLQEHPQFKLVEQTQMFPGEVGNDGFFIAKMIRSTNE